jgi:hypothetical protein
MVLFTIRFREVGSRIGDAMSCPKISFDKEASMALIVMPFLVTAAAVSMFVLATERTNDKQRS